MPQSPPLSERVKARLRKWSPLYKLLQKIYYRILRAAESVFGTRLHEWIWGSQAYLSIAEYSKTVQHPHREFLADAMARLLPFDSILEIGCNVGPNLQVLAQRFPGVALYGVDINREAVEQARQTLTRQGIQKLHLQTARADDLSFLKDKSIDIVFTDATLLYIGPDKLDRVLQEMKRVGKKYLLFNEWSLPPGAGGKKKSFWYDLHWVHDYSGWLSPYVSNGNITFMKLPERLWGPGGWQEYGALIEVKL